MLPIAFIIFITFLPLMLMAPMLSPLDAITFSMPLMRFRYFRRRGMLSMLIDKDSAAISFRAMAAAESARKMLMMPLSRDFRYMIYGASC